MTMDNWRSQMGTGVKHITERYAEYPAPVHDQQLYYTYEPSPPSSPSHGHVVSSKHHYGGGGGGGGHKHNAAMSALTLLAFLFFLHILQQCLKEHMTAMSTPQVTVVSAGREGDRIVAKTSNKLDKGGLVHQVAPLQSGVQINKMANEDNAPHSSTESEDIFLTKIAATEHTPQRGRVYKNKMLNYNNGSSTSGGFVSAMGGK